MQRSFGEIKAKYKWMQWVSLIIYIVLLAFIIWGTYFTYVNNSHSPAVQGYTLFVCIFTGLILYPNIYSLIFFLRNLFSGNKMFEPYDKIINTQIVNGTKKVAIIYVTKDDFIPEALLSAINQTYKNASVFVLDDSTDETNKKTIDDFCRQTNNTFSIIRRTSGEKNKAGNVNNFLALYRSQFQYMFVMDSDTYIAKDAITNCLKYFQEFNDIGLIQCCSYPLTNIKNAFQDLYVPNYKNDKTYWANDAVVTSECCITLCIGHSCMYDLNALDKIGSRIPKCVAEDTAVSVSLLNAGYSTIFAGNILSMDETPPSFKSWKSRYLHWETGNFDFFAKYFFKVCVGKYNLAFKSYILWWSVAGWIIPLFLFSTNLFAFGLCYTSWEYIPWIPWLISIVGAGFCASFIPQKNKVSRGSFKANAKHMLALSCSSIAVMPTALAKFFCLWFTKKTFKVTNKKQEKVLWYQTFTQNPIDHIFWLCFFTFIIFTCAWTQNEFHWIFILNPILWVDFVGYISLFILPWTCNKKYGSPRHNDLYKELV